MRIILLPLIFVILLLHSNSVSAQPENPLEIQLISFITGLQSENPKQTVELWILGVENRSGAVQFALHHQPFKNLQRRSSRKVIGALDIQALRLIILGQQKLKK